MFEYKRVNLIVPSKVNSAKMPLVGMSFAPARTRVTGERALGSRSTSLCGTMSGPELLQAKWGTAYPNNNAELLKKQRQRAVNFIAVEVQQCAVDTFGEETSNISRNILPLETRLMEFSYRIGTTM
jgi:hypothetical protein